MQEEHRGAGALIVHRVTRRGEHCVERRDENGVRGGILTLSRIPPSGGLVGQEFQRDWL